MANNGSTSWELSADQKFQAALARFQDHTELLRTLTSLDLQVFGGYITVQLGLAAWLTEHPVSNTPARWGLLLVDITFSALAAKLLHNQYKRRNEVREGLRNVIAFFRFTDPGAYIAVKPLDAETIFRPWLWWYLVGLCVVAVGVAITIFGTTGPTILVAQNAGSGSVSLNPSQTVFMLFFAIFWGALANVQPRWKAFQYPLWKTVRPQVGRRCLLAIGIFNVAPLCYFLFAMLVLNKPSGNSVTFIDLLTGIVPAFAVFGLYRFWLFAIEKWPEVFYKTRRVSCDSDAGADGLVKEYWHVEPIIRKEYYEPPITTATQNATAPEQKPSPGPGEGLSLPVIDIGNDKGRANLRAGVIYMLVTTIVLILSRL